MFRRARRFAVLALVASVLGGLLAGGIVASAPASAAITSPFSRVFTTNVNGDIIMAANTLETCVTSATCTTAQSATAGGSKNNDFTSRFVDVDSDAGTFNSSSATLTVPTDGSVLFAALVWSGRTPTTSGTANADPALRGNVRFTVPNGAGTTTQALTGSVDVNAGSGAVGYQGYVDVTDTVKAAGSGVYTVANVQSSSGNTDNYAGWALVVAVADPSAAMRNLTIFKGFGIIQTNPASDNTATFTVNGFLTPPAGTVKTTVGAVVWEGDRGSVGDSMTLNGTALTDGLNPVNDVFNSTISNRGAQVAGRNPAYTNQLGMDADLFQAPDNLVPNGATSASITVNTASETYYPGIITFATELYDPKLNGTKTATLQNDVNSNGLFDIGDTIRYSVSMRNDGLDTSAESTFFDAIPTGTVYVPGSITIDGTSRTDAAGDDQADFAVGPNGGAITGRVGIGANAALGGDVATYNPATPAVAVHTVGFDAVITGAVAAQGIVNVADLTYRGKTTQARNASVSNVVVNVVPAAGATNQPPVAPSRVVSITPTTTTPSISVNVLGGATDPENDTITLVDVTDAAGGTVVVSGGTVTYTPNPGFAGRDVFTYTVQDSAGNRTTGVVRVDVVNTVPVAVDDARNVSHSVPTAVPVLGNDTDANGDALSIRSVTVNGTVVSGSGTATTAKGGTVTLAGGAITYTPAAGGLPVGQTDVFSYIVQDARGGSAPANVTLTSINSAPTAVADTATTTAGTPVIVDARTGDTDPDGDTLTATSTSTPAHGTVVTLGDGTFQYTPTAGYTGSDSFTYQVSDGRGGVASSTVTIQVTAASTAVTLTIAPATVEYGSPSTLTAGSLPAGATGTVEFRAADGTVLCTATLPDTDCDTATTLAVGTYQVTAVYSGDASHAASTSAPTALEVTKRTSTIVAAISDASITYGETPTLSVTGVPAGATGTVEYRDQNGVLVCTSSAAPWTCATPATLAVGTYSITATYSGDARNAPSTAAPIDLEVVLIPVTISETVVTPSLTYGQTSSLTVSGVPAGATGTVTYRAADGSVLCAATVAPWSCSTSATLPVGSYQVTATYSGDARHTSAADGPEALTVAAATTAVTLTVTPASVAYGTPSTLLAGGLPAGATGTVEFRAADGTVLCAAILPDLDCTTSTTLAVGTYSVTAVYLGDANHTGSSSTAEPLQVTRAATAVGVTVSNGGSVPYGTPATVTGTGLPAGATGTVEFRAADGTVLCSTTLPANACQTSVTLPVGDYTVTAVYSGDANHAGSTSAPADLEVTTAIPGTITVTTGGSSVFGTPATLTVFGITAGSTGTVEFRAADGTVLCTATLPATSCTAPAGLPVGTYAITGVYSGDTNHAGATSAPAALSVVARPTTVTATAPGGATAVFGTPIAVAATGLPTGAPAATGTVEFRDPSGTVLCTTTLPATSCDLPATLPVGTHQIVAVYSGDTNNQGSTSAPLTIQVDPAPSTPVATAPASATVGQQVPVTVTGIPAGATGTVQFRDDNGTVLCTTTLPTRTCTAGPLALGTTGVTPYYSGDATYSASTGSRIAITVAAVPVASAATGLAVTGSGLPVGATAAAGVLLLTGLGLLVGARRRRRGAHLLVG